MAVKLSSLGGAAWQFFTDNGIPLAGGKLFSYAAGTTNPAATYTSATGLVANTNPIILDSAGRVAGAVWLTEGQLYKFVLQTATNVTIGTWDNIAGVNDVIAISGTVSTLSADVAALQNFDTSLGQGGGSSLVGFINSGVGAAATTVQARLRETVSVKDFDAQGNGSADDTSEIQAALFAAAGRTVFFPAGTYIVTSPLTVPAGTTLFGANSQATSIVFRNCDGFSVQGNSVTISDMQLVSQTAGGGADPKNKVGIRVTGVNGARLSRFVGERLYLRGWNACVYWSYTEASSLLQCVSINSTYSLYLFGQSVDNYVANCELAGFTPLRCVSDTGAGSNNTGEGLMVTNTRITSEGGSCALVDKFRALGLVNCVVNSSAFIGLELTDCQAVLISSCSINANAYCVLSNNTTTAADIEMGNTITGCWMQSSGGADSPIYIGNNNVGWSITGNSLKSNVVCVDTSVSSKSIAITGNYLSTAATYGLTLRGTDTVQANNVGNDAVTP